MWQMVMGISPIISPTKIIEGTHRPYPPGFGAYGHFWYWLVLRYCCIFQICTTGAWVPGYKILVCF